MSTEPRRDAAFFAAGLLATAGQVLLLRELVVDVAGDESAVGIGLAAWFVGIAAGASLARRCAGRDPAAAAATSAMALVVLAAGGIVGGRWLRAALAPSAGELPGVGLTLLLALATLAPAGAAVGAAFTQLACAAAAAGEPGGAVRRLYVVESLGSLAGGLVVALVCGAGVSPLPLAAALGAASAALAAHGLVERRRPLTAVAVAAFLALVAARPVDRWTEAVRFSRTSGGLVLFASADTPYQHLAVGGDDVRHLFSSGQYASSFPDPYAAEGLGHLVALLAPAPGRVLLLGGVERGLLPVLLRHPVSKLTLLEPDAGALAFLEPLLPPAERRALGDPRVSVVTADPRQWLSSPARPGSFDLVVQLGPEPATLLRARLATVEFYRLAARSLSAEGVIVTRLPAAPTVLAGEAESLAAVQLRTLRAALPIVRVSVGPEAFAIAGRSAGAVTLDPGVLAARWRQRGVVSSSFDAALLPSLLPPEQVAARQSALDGAAAAAALSSDDRPVSFLHALARRQQVVSGASGRFVRAVLELPPAAVVPLAFLPSLAALAGIAMRRLTGAARRTGDTLRAAVTHALAVTGAAGLVWSLLGLVSFQAAAGALYGLLGALVAVFMLGLALGGALAPRALRSEAGDEASPSRAVRALQLWLLAAVTFALALPVALAAAAHASAHGTPAALLAHGGLLLAAGFVTGGVFPLAIHVRLAAGDSVAAAAGGVETADHLGAATGALCGAAWLLPALGLRRSALLLGALLAVAALGVVWAGRRNG